MLAFGPGCLPSGNDSDYVACFTLTVTDNKEPGTDAQTKHDKAVFTLGMLLVVELNRIFIEKYGPRLFKGNAVLLLIGCILPRIPFEPYHTYNVLTSFGSVKPRHQLHSFVASPVRDTAFGCGGT